MADDKKGLNNAALNEEELENVAGGMTGDYRRQQRQAADMGRAGIASYAKNMNTKSTKSAANKD